MLIFLTRVAKCVSVVVQIHATVKPFMNSKPSSALESVRESVREYEKHRRNAISSSERTTSGHHMHEDSKQEPTSVPNTRRILFVQTRIHAKSDNTDS